MTTEPKPSSVQIAGPLAYQLKRLALEENTTLQALVAEAVAHLFSARKRRDAELADRRKRVQEQIAEERAKAGLPAKD